MKYFIIGLIMFQSCANATLIDSRDVERCLNDQVDLYGDLCGESDTDGEDAHFNGVNCAVESTKACLDVMK